MTKFKKSLYIVFFIFISLFMCYRLIEVIGSLCIKRAVNKVSQNRVHVERVQVGFNLHSANIRFNNVSLLIQNRLHGSAKIKTILVRVKLKSLFNKKLVCEEIIITGPNVNIVSTISRRLKTQKVVPKKVPSSKKWNYVFKRIELRRGTANYQRCNIPSKLSIKNIYLALNDFSLTRPFPFFLKGYVLSGENRTKFSVSGKAIHIPESLRIADMEIESSIRLSSPTTPIDFTGKVILKNNITSLEIEKGIYDDIKIIAPHLPLYIKDRALYIHGVELKLADGKTEIFGKVGFDLQRGIEFDLNHKTSGVDIEKLASKFGIENLTFSGALDCEGNIRSSGNSINKIIKNLNGNLDITLNNGSFTEQHVLVRMFTLINMYDVIKLRLPKMDKDGIKYNTVVAKTVIDSGIINVESLCVDGERMRISGEGNINLVKESTDMVFGVKLFQIVDDVLNKIPIVGYIVTGEKENLFAFYVRLKSGKGGYLKVTAVPYELLEDVTVRLFQRLLKLPLKMMRPIVKSINKKNNAKNKR